MSLPCVGFETAGFFLVSSRFLDDATSSGLRALSRRVESPSTGLWNEDAAYDTKQ